MDSSGPQVCADLRFKNQPVRYNDPNSGSGDDRQYDLPYKLVEKLSEGGMGVLPQRIEQMSHSTTDILQHHLEAFGKGDLPGVLSDYTDESVLITQEKTLRGPQEISPLFEAMFAEFAKPGVSFAMKSQTIERETAYIVWTAETADNVYELGTDTFIVRDGKIAVQTFAAKITPKS